MNGATTEPLISTTNPPTTTIMMRLGSSQNFLRTHINRESSARKLISLSPLELVFHRFRSRPGRAPLDPIAVDIGRPFESQEVLAKRPHNEAGRQHRAEEYEGHHYWSHNLVQQQSQLKPKPMEGL